MAGVYTLALPMAIVNSMPPEPVAHDEALKVEAKNLERTGNKLQVIAARLRLVAAKWREKVGRRAD